MGYDQGLAERIRSALESEGTVSERHMFGGIAFMLQGNMCVGLVAAELMLRVGRGNYDKLLKLPGARPMDFTGRPMAGYLFVAGSELEDDGALHGWIDQAVRFVKTLPPKSSLPRTEPRERRPPGPAGAKPRAPKARRGNVTPKTKASV